MAIGLLALCIAVILGVMVMLTATGESEPRHKISLSSQKNITVDFSPIEF